jgi:hypothetical protein
MRPTDKEFDAYRRQWNGRSGISWAIYWLIIEALGKCTRHVIDGWHVLEYGRWIYWTDGIRYVRIGSIAGDNDRGYTAVLSTYTPGVCYYTRPLGSKRYGTSNHAEPLTAIKQLVQAWVKEAKEQGFWCDPRGGCNTPRIPFLSWDRMPHELEGLK